MIAPLGNWLTCSAKDWLQATWLLSTLQAGTAFGGGFAQRIIAGFGCVQAVTAQVTDCPKTAMALMEAQASKIRPMAGRFLMDDLPLG